MLTKEVIRVIRLYIHAVAARKLEFAEIRTTKKFAYVPRIVLGWGSEMHLRIKYRTPISGRLSAKPPPVASRKLNRSIYYRRPGLFSVGTQPRGSGSLSYLAISPIHFPLFCVFHILPSTGDDDGAPTFCKQKGVTGIIDHTTAVNAAGRP